MTPAELKFKSAVHTCIVHGFYPSPQRIKKHLGRCTHPFGYSTHKTCNSINGRECVWRDEVFAELKYKPKAPR